MGAQSMKVLVHVSCIRVTLARYQPRSSVSRGDLRAGPVPSCFRLGGARTSLIRHVLYSLLVLILRVAKREDCAVTEPIPEAEAFIRFRLEEMEERNETH